MKIKFIPILLVLGLASANSQITTASGSTVYVSEGTLVYSTGNITVKSGTTKFTNNGNIQIGKIGESSSGTYIADSDVTEGMLLTYTDTSTYGQLIVDGATSAASGTLTKQYNLSNTGGTKVYFASPFLTYSANSLMRDLTDGAQPYIDDVNVLNCWPGACRGSSYNVFPILGWNQQYYRFDPILINGDDFSAGDFYLLRKNSSYFSAVDFTAVHSFSGTPFVALSSNSAKSLVTRDFQIGNGARNVYRVKYYTYLTDPFATDIKEFTESTTNDALDAAYYSSNMLELTNPYTSNIDLSVLTNSYANLKGIASYRGVTTSATASTRYSGLMLYATVDNGTLVGDNLQYIPPMTNFVLKGADDQTGITVTFADGTTSHKTFEKSTIFDLTAKSDPASRQISTASKSTNSVGIGAKSTNSFDSYQLNLQMWNTAQSEFIGNTYVYSSPSQVTGKINDNETINTSINSTTTGVYSLPEAATGGVDPNNPNTKLYINTINTDAAKVAIPLAINISSSEDVSDYIFKVNLKESGDYLINKKTMNFSNSSAKYYIHDKKTGSVTELTEGMTYPVKIQSESDDNYVTANSDGSKTISRYEIFWKEVGTMGADEVSTLEDITNIYKTEGEYKIRFNKNWNKADVIVFNAVGQLISTEKNIDTNSDYVLPIKGSSSTMYIIKIMNDKGESVTKKIVK